MSAKSVSRPRSRQRVNATGATTIASVMTLASRVVVNAKYKTSATASAIHPPREKVKKKVKHIGTAAAAASVRRAAPVLRSPAIASATHSPITIMSDRTFQ